MRPVKIMDIHHGGTEGTEIGMMPLSSPGSRHPVVRDAQCLGTGIGEGRH